MYKIFTTSLFITLALFTLTGQTTIKLVNPSFEDNPHAGTTENNSITGWSDCGRMFFKSETPPDIHLGMDRNNTKAMCFFGVRQPSSDGFTFLGLVVRDNDSYESVTQRLSQPIEGGKCYSFSIDLSRSMSYTSPYNSLQNPESDDNQQNEKTKPKLYTKPVVLRIYGGSTPCGKRELLAESTEVKNAEWQTYEFEFTPNQTHRYFTITAFYKVPVLLPYNGNLLVDNASDIVQIKCPDEEEEEVFAEEPVIKKDPVKKPVKEPKQEKVEEPVEEVIAYTPPPVVKKEKPKMVINKELDKKTLKEGQIIKIKNLYFDADSIVINPKSIPALTELASFLKFYPEVKIEIGGHTNGRPTHEFCDSLSTARAKSVAEFLYNEGIPQNQVEYKGYGKRDPIASNDYAEGRRRNQRVEIRVLSIDS